MTDTLVLPEVGELESSATRAAFEPSALEHAMRPLAPILEDPTVLELCINQPGFGFVERSQAAGTGWLKTPMPFATKAWCQRLAKLVANRVRQRIEADAPLLSAGLPGGERIQLVLPPACPADTVAITIRKPSPAVWSLDELEARGAFAHIRGHGKQNAHLDTQLETLLARRQYPEFFRTAVRARKTILISGATGSGKTTFAKALVQEIDTTERLITIEDAAELVMDRHPNHVRLFYSKGDQGLARVSPKQLIECSLRMRPDRLLLAELRGEEAFDYLRAVGSGHPGSITSIHAASADLAFEQLALLVKQSPAGREFSRAEIHELLQATVDIVVQFEGASGTKRIREVRYTPPQRRAQIQAATSPPSS